MPGLNNYSRTNWQTGDVVDEVKLNNIEEQVESVTNTLLDNGNAPVFSTTSKYAPGDLVLYEGYTYKCAYPVTTAGDWTGEENWERTNLGAEMVSIKRTINTTLDETRAAIANKADKSEITQLPKIVDTDAENVDLDVADTSGNVIMRLSGGHIQTKEFDSSELLDLFDEKQDTLTFDTEPTKDSKNPITSGGVHEALQNIAPLDRSLSLETAAAPADMVGDLKSAITNKATITGSDAEDVDLDIADSVGNVILRLADGHVQTKEFNSADVGNLTALETTEKTTIVGAINEVEESIREINDLDMPLVDETNATDVDLDVTDRSGNVIARFVNGGIETKKFRGYKYIEFVKDGTTTNQSITITINQNFKRGDRIVLHTDRGAYPYNAPWNAGVKVTYYEDNRPIISDARIDIAYIEHTITEDTSSISVEYDGTLSSGRQTVTLHVYLLGDIPITPNIIRVKTDGTGDYTSLRNAVDAIGLNADDYIHPYIIEVYPGTYDVLSDYDDTEINAAVSSFNDTSFVGLKLLNGVSLIGIGNPDNIILTASLSESGYTSDVRGGISTINKQGSGSIENVTIVSHNLRYCVHDDFGSQHAKRIKRLYKNCIFRAYNSAYTPDTSYGAGMPVGGMDAEFISCDFGENGGLHLNSQLTSFVTIRFVNCKGLGFRIGDNITATNATMSEYIFENCDFEHINYSLAGTSPHVRIRGSGNKSVMMNAPASLMYVMDSVIPVPITRLSADVGDVVEKYATNTHGPRYQAATSIDKACGIVVFKDASDVYVQTIGYVRTDRAGLSSFNLNDYIGLKNGTPVVVQNADDAFGRIKFVDSDNNGYIYLNWR